MIGSDTHKNIRLSRYAWRFRHAAYGFLDANFAGIQYKHRCVGISVEATGIGYASTTTVERNIARNNNANTPF